MYTLRKPTTIAVVLALVLALLLGALAMFGGKAASADAIGSELGPDVDPKIVSGNPSCTELGFAYGFKPLPEPPPSGTYTQGPLTVNIVSDGTYFDWTSNIGVDAVIVKGGTQGADTYIYDPPKESKGDDGLHAPNNSNGQPAGISHIEFCYDLELEVSKTADTELTRTYDWTIEKSVSPANWDLFRGDSGTSGYDVTVTNTGSTDSDWKVSGTITVKSPIDATITGVSDVITPPGDTLNTNVDCGVSFPHSLQAGQELNCTYNADLSDDSLRTNTATATTSTSGLDGGSGTASVDFASAEINEVNETVTVDDTYSDGPQDELVSVGQSPRTFQYDRTFACDEDEGTHENTATIVETGQSDDASVTVNCYELGVSKTAETSFTRKYDWTIDKTAAPAEKTIAPGESFQASYSVTVNTTDNPTDSAHEVHGQITVSNPADAPDAKINSVSDVVSGAGAATVDCGTTTFPHTLAAGDTLTCSYSKNLDDNSSRTNTATATLQNHQYDSAGNATANGTTDFSGSAQVTFGDNPTTEVDKTITVTDPVAPNGGNLGTATYGVDNLPKTFESYSQTIGPYPNECGDKQVNNTATFVANDTGATGSDTATVTAHVQCKAKVVKTVSGQPPSSGQFFNFELRQGASITSDGTTLEQKTTDSSGNISFAALLVPGQTYQICELVMPGWNTNLSGDGPLFVPGSMTTPTLPNPNVNNMTVCTNFTAQAGSTPRTFNVDNTPPPGGRALTIGFWKNWASCANSAGKGQKAMLDLALGIASSQTTNPPGGLVVSAQNAGGLWPNYAAAYYLILKGDPSSTINNIKPAAGCSWAVNLLNKSTIEGKKMASDPLFNMTAQLLAAQLNRFMGAGISGTTITNINRAVLLNGKYQFNGKTYSPKLTTADTNLANCLAKQLDNYNNNRPVSACP